MLSRKSVSYGLTLSYSSSLVAGVAYLTFYQTQTPMVIPIIVTLSRIGGSMSFNIGYLSVARLFPTEFVARVFGVVNLIAHLITVGAPMVAEIADPTPFRVFSANALVAIIVCRYLVELKDTEDL